MPLWSHYYVKDLHNGKQLKLLLDLFRTPWGGLDSEQPNEVCRHWPWNPALFARAFVRAGMPEEAFSQLKRWLDYSASNGALPEKVLIDGYEIGFWYPTPCACYLQSLAESFARREGDTLYLLQGFDGQWRNMSAENLRLEENCTISIRVEEGTVTLLQISGPEPRKIVLNPAYSMHVRTS